MLYAHTLLFQEGANKALEKVSNSLDVTGRWATDSRVSSAPTVFAHVLKRARLHDEEALVELYQRALPIIYRYVLARLGRPDLAEDVVSEVFLTMVESIGGLRTEEEAGFYAWLIQIAQGKISRTLRYLIRTNRRQVSLPDTSAIEGRFIQELMAMDLISNPAAFHEWQETLEEIGMALGKLSDEQQAIIVGRFLAGERIEDLALALGKQPGAVRVLQFRALKTLAKHLGLVRGSHSKDKGGRR
jgi:RNA polymerase sigma factor (sigma-70 family)